MHPGVFSELSEAIARPAIAHRAATELSPARAGTPPDSPSLSARACWTTFSSNSSRSGGDHCLGRPTGVFSRQRCLVVSSLMQKVRQVERQKLLAERLINFGTRSETNTVSSTILTHSTEELKWF